MEIKKVGDKRVITLYYNKIIKPAKGKNGDLKDGWWWCKKGSEGINNDRGAIYASEAGDFYLPKVVREYKCMLFGVALRIGNDCVKIGTLGTVPTLYTYSGISIMLTRVGDKPVHSAMCGYTKFQRFLLKIGYELLYYSLGK
jgi:hypothetical protein